jgi:hypothetical protein
MEEKKFLDVQELTDYIHIVLTPQIAGHNLKNKLGLIKFGNYDKSTKKFYTRRTIVDSSGRRA